MSAEFSSQPHDVLLLRTTFYRRRAPTNLFSADHNWSPCSPPAALRGLTANETIPDLPFRALVSYTDCICAALSSPTLAGQIDKRLNRFLASIPSSERSQINSSYPPHLSSTSTSPKCLNPPATSGFQATLTPYSLPTRPSFSPGALSSRIPDGVAPLPRPRMAGAHFGCVQQVSSKPQPYGALLGCRPHRSGRRTHGRRYSLHGQVERRLGARLLIDAQPRRYPVVGRGKMRRFRALALPGGRLH
ncbi:hypothetical protein EDB86DRAFT_2938833 [Lactarius hatsudake]|nr:hypothetical protein EDB86DRAFT_2938833 [Lactarius hatsudake]